LVSYLEIILLGFLFSVIHMFCLAIHNYSLLHCIISWYSISILHLKHFLCIWCLLGLYSDVLLTTSGLHKSWAPGCPDDKILHNGGLIFVRPQYRTFCHYFSNYNFKAAPVYSRNFWTPLLHRLFDEEWQASSVMCEAGCDCVKVVCEHLPVNVLNQRTGHAAGIKYSQMCSSTSHNPATSGVL
jgi:hypothetical protein